MIPAQPTFERVTTSAEIFEKGTSLLLRQNCNEVLIYAPTGAWVSDDEKEKWFWTIAYCLLNGIKDPEYMQLKQQLDQKFKQNNARRRSSSPPKKNLHIETPTTKIGMFHGVYGIPPLTHPQFDEWFTSLSDLLSVFDDIPTAYLHFLKTETDTIPGSGAIIIDSNTFIGFAINGRYKVDFGLIFADNTDVAQSLRQWYDNHVLKELTAHNIIQDLTKGISATEGMQKILQGIRKAQSPVGYSGQLRIFISYSHDDTGITEQLAEFLGRTFHSNNVWFDRSPEGVRGGTTWWDDIVKHISDCDVFIFMISNESLESKWCTKEFQEARHQGKYILPIQVRRTLKTVPDWLNKTQVVNMTKGFVEADTLNEVYSALLNISHGSSKGKKTRKSSRVGGSATSKKSP